MEIMIYQVDAFTDKPFGGNPAGVVPDARDLNEDDMQKIALEMNLSETAFITMENKEYYKVRFFTPECEVDLCGHATIASFYTLAHKGYINSLDNGVVTVKQETKAGILPVEIYFDEGKVVKVMMHQAKPKCIRGLDNQLELSEIFGLDVREIGLNNHEIAPEIISTGLSDIIVPVKSKESLYNIKVNFDKLSELSNELEVVGVHVFTIDNGRIFCRNFAPAVGINEEAATGTANGALMYYLKKNNVISGTEIECNQGEKMNRPSKIICRCEGDEFDTIKVGGIATIVIEGIINI